MPCTLLLLPVMLVAFSTAMNVLSLAVFRVSFIMSVTQFSLLSVTSVPGGDSGMPSHSDIGRLFFAISITSFATQGCLPWANSLNLEDQWPTLNLAAKLWSVWHGWRWPYQGASINPWLQPRWLSRSLRQQASKPQWHCSPLLVDHLFIIDKPFKYAMC